MSTESDEPRFILHRTLPEAYNRIAQVRKSKGMSQQQLAEAVGSHLVTISKLERDKMKFTYEWAVRLAKALDVSPLDIYGVEAPDRAIKVSGLLTERGKIKLAEKYRHFPDFTSDVYFKDNENSVWLYTDSNDLYPFLQYGDLVRVEKMDIVNTTRYLNRLCAFVSSDATRHLLGILRWHPDTWKMDVDCFNAPPLRGVDISEIWMVTMILPSPDAGGQSHPNPVENLSFDRVLDQADKEGKPDG